MEDIHTDKQDGTLNEFIEKEGKWFNYIKGSCDTLDTAAFNFQGLGVTNLVTGECLPCAAAAVLGCTDPIALNYNDAATVNDGSCTYPPLEGCTDPLATNYVAAATIDDGSCTYAAIYGCTDPTATNYDPSATIDDGSCLASVACQSALTNFNGMEFDQGQTSFVFFVFPLMILSQANPNMTQAQYNLALEAHWWQVLDASGAVVQGGPLTWCNGCGPGGVANGQGTIPGVGQVPHITEWNTMSTGTYTLEVFHVSSTLLTYDPAATVINKWCHDYTV